MWHKGILRKKGSPAIMIQAAFPHGAADTSVG
jgi:hypothetical protein